MMNKKEYDKLRYQENKEKIKARSRLFYKNNSEVKKKYQNSYRLKNKKKINKYFSSRRKSDLIFRLSGNLRTRLNRFLKQKNWHKDNKLKEYLGCTLEEFKIHLESKFQKGMNWDNYGEWQIDHIIPLSSSSSLINLMKLNHYTNLQPLWKIDNIKKGGKYER